MAPSKSAYVLNAELHCHVRSVPADITPVCQLLLTMLCHHYAHDTEMKSERSTAQDALKDGLWSMKEDEPPFKKRAI